MVGLTQDDNGSAYLIIILIFINAIVAMIYMISSDIMDMIVPIGLNVQSGLASTNSDTTFVQDVLMFLFKYIPVWVVIGVDIMYVYAMGQKPERAY